MRDRLRPVLWCTGLALSAWVLHILGRGPLGSPPLPTDWPAWIERVGPASAVVATVRQLAVVAVWYLIVVTVIGALFRRIGAHRAVSALDTVTPRLVRRFLASACGLVASTAGLAAAVGPLAVGVDVDRPAIASSSSTTTPAPLGQRPAEITLRRTDPPAQASESDPPVLARLDFGLAPLGAENSDRGGAAAETWEVACGDHFWSIAEETLVEARGRAVDDDEIDVYWRMVIEANRDRLVAPDNPDLLLPGQVLVLPDPGVVDQTPGV